MKKRIWTTAICMSLAVLLSGCGGTTAEKAMDIAYAHTGVDVSKSEIISTSPNITDAAGNEIVVVDFVNDGTEYICKVDAKKNAVISVSKEKTNISEGNAYSLEEAKQTALKTAGLTADRVVFTKAKAEYDDGRIIYEVEFISDAREYEYDINADTLEIISSDIDLEKIPAKPQDSITEDDAKEIALKSAGFTADNVTFTKVKLDEDDGVYCYDIEFVNGGIEYEYEIHAATGAIIEAVKDNDDEYFMYVDMNDTAGKGDNAGDFSNLISREEAVNIALKDAGYSESDVKMTRSGLDYDDGIAKYDVEFCAECYEYDYEINAVSGEILERSKEKNDEGGIRDQIHEHAGKEGISLGDAKHIALSDAGLSASEVSFGTAKKDRDDGVTYYEIEFYKGGVEYSYEISLSGKILEKDVDRD